MSDALLPVLRKRANSRGLVLASERSLLQAMRLDSTALQTAMVELEAGSAIEVLSPLPFLVARLHGNWSGKSSEGAKTAAKIGAPVARDHSHSFQSFRSQSKQLNESYRQPVANDALLREILAALGESDPASFRGALQRYSPGVIRSALDRVRRTRSVRKNRTALFRYLLPRIAKELPSIN